MEHLPLARRSVGQAGASVRLRECAPSRKNPRVKSTEAPRKQGEGRLSRRTLCAAGSELEGPHRYGVCAGTRREVS